MVNHEPHSTVGCTTHIFKALIDYKWCSAKCQSLIWQSSNHSRNRKYYKTLSELPPAFISMLAVTVTDNGDIQVLSSQLLPLHCDCFTVGWFLQFPSSMTTNTCILIIYFLPISPPPPPLFFVDTNVSFHTTNVASLNSGQETNIPASATHTHKSKDSPCWILQTSANGLGTKNLYYNIFDIIKERRKRKKIIHR